MSAVVSSWVDISVASVMDTDVVDSIVRSSSEMVSKILCVGVKFTCKRIATMRAILNGIYYEATAHPVFWFIQVQS